MNDAPPAGTAAVPPASTWIVLATGIFLMLVSVGVWLMILFAQSSDASTINTQGYGATLLGTVGLFMTLIALLWRRKFKPARDDTPSFLIRE